MSYGNCKRAGKKIKCPMCGTEESQSPILFALTRISAGRRWRYLCGKCYWNHQGEIKQLKGRVLKCRDGFWNICGHWQPKGGAGNE